MRGVLSDTARRSPGTLRGAVERCCDTEPRRLAAAAAAAAPDADCHRRSAGGAGTAAMLAMMDPEDTITAVRSEDRC